MRPFSTHREHDQQMALDGLQFWNRSFASDRSPCAEHQTQPANRSRAFVVVADKAQYYHTVGFSTEICFGWILPDPLVISQHTNSVTLTSLNAQRQAVHQQSTDVTALRLERNQEVKLLTFDALVTYPLMVSVNLLFTTPNKTPAISEEIDAPAEADEANPSLSILNIGSATTSPTTASEHGNSSAERQL